MSTSDPLMSFYKRCKQTYIYRIYVLLYTYMLMQRLPELQAFIFL